MVIKGKIRGSGAQLASYLLAQGENELVRVLDVDGRLKAQASDVRTVLQEMSLKEQLTRSRKGIYHAIINPSEEESRRMKKEDWLKAADILAAELGFQEQRWVMVLHQKTQRLHCHVAFERYDVETGKMKTISHNYRKHDRARAKMEAAFLHQPTARRNPNRPVMKAALSALWKESRDGKSFIAGARKQGYVITAGFDRIPFMVMDETGRSFNLCRHLDRVKLKEVREKLGAARLPGEKDAIAFVRVRQQTTGSTAFTETPAGLVQSKDNKINLPGKEKNEAPPAGSPAMPKTEPVSSPVPVEPQLSTREAFLENLKQQRGKQQTRQRGPRLG